MKILMLAPQPFFQPRGTPFSVLHRLKALSILGHHVDLITYHLGEDIPVENVNIFRTRRLPFVKNIDIGPSFKKIFCDVFLLIKAIKFLMKNRYDVLHTHEEAGFMAMFLKPLFRIPYIYDMHSSLPQQLRNFKRGNSRLISKVFEWLEKMTLNRADGIITICSDLQSIVKTIAANKNPVLIENVADHSTVFGRPVYINVKEKYNLPENRRIVLYTGTFERYQGVEMLIESGCYLFKEHGDVVMVLVGGKSEQIGKMKRLAEGYEIDEKIIFTGTVHPGEIESFYRISDIIASPRIEGTNSPLKIYSYLRSGKPIVATNLYTHTQVLNKDIAVLTEAVPEKFAGGISKLLIDEELRQRIASAAKKVSEEKYGYEDYLRKTELIYKNIRSAYV